MLLFNALKLRRFGGQRTFGASDGGSCFLGWMDAAWDRHIKTCWIFNGSMIHRYWDYRSFCFSALSRRRRGGWRWSREQSKVRTQRRWAGRKKRRVCSGDLMVICQLCFETLSLTLAPAFIVRWLPRCHVVIATQPHAPVGQQQPNSSYRGRCAESRPVPERRAWNHLLGQQRQRQSADSGRSAARARNHRAGRETDRGQLGGCCKQDARRAEARKQWLTSWSSSGGRYPARGHSWRGVSASPGLKTGKLKRRWTTGPESFWAQLWQREVYALQERQERCDDPRQLVLLFQLNRNRIRFRDAFMSFPLNRLRRSRRVKVIKSQLVVSLSSISRLEHRRERGLGERLWPGHDGRRGPDGSL